MIQGFEPAAGVQQPLQYIKFGPWFNLKHFSMLRNLMYFVNLKGTVKEK